MIEREVAGLRVREHDGAGRTVFVLHGGPGASGEATPAAEGLARWFRVVEPWQRRADAAGDPLTVARHVADLHALLGEYRAPGEAPPAVLGHSWGAMLALSYAAAHPDDVGPLVLVGCGTYDPAARAEIERRLEARADPEIEARFEKLADEHADPMERAFARHELVEAAYAYELDAARPRPRMELDMQGAKETWADVMRLQDEGVEPAAFASIRSPVLMVHGEEDPHPGALIRDSLLPFVGQLQYHALRRCGHAPWLERHARDKFFEVVRDWLLDHS